VDVMNLREGDVLTITITAPDGSAFAQQRIPFAKAKAVYFGYIGKKNSSGALAAGNYTASVVVMRGGEKPVASTRVVEVK
jgi:hypothetical protein